MLKIVGLHLQVMVRASDEPIALKEESAPPVMKRSVYISNSALSLK